MTSRRSRTEEDTAAVRNLLTAHDPAASYPSDPAARELSRIEVIASGQRPRRVSSLVPRGRLLRPALGLAATVAAAAVLLPLAVQADRPAYAGPPPVPLEAPPSERSDARDHLLSLAEAAGSQPPLPRSGDVAYVRTSEWTFTLSQDADSGEAGWGIVPQDLQVWRAPDESGRSVAVPNPPEHQGGDPGPLAALFGSGPEEFEWGDGEGGNGMFFTWEPADLSTDPERLEEQLIEGAANGGYDDSDAEAALFYALQILYVEAPVDSEVQAAILRVLAEHDGVRYAGTAEDRQGREGELFVVEDGTEPGGDQLERRILFDADTGMPLYHEIVAVESDAEQPEGAELPRVNHYAAIVKSAWVPEVGDRP
jgi:hypothetical protein